MMNQVENSNALFEFTSTIDGLTYYVRHSLANEPVAENITSVIHKHHAIEFHCIFSGNATVTIPCKKQTVQIKSGQILMIPADVFHAFHCETPTEHFAFRFSIILPDQNTSSPILEPFVDIDEYLLIEDSGIFSMLLQHQQLLQQNATPFCDVQKGTLLLNVATQIIGRIPAMHTSFYQPSPHIPMQKWLIEDYISECFDQANSIKELADILHMSQSQARKLVRFYLGEDFKSVITRHRMELADILLQNSLLTFEEIAWEAGYSSYSGFYLSFKKFFGITPSKRREQFQAAPESYQL